MGMNKTNHNVRDWEVERYTLQYLIQVMSAAALIHLCFLSVPVHLLICDLDHKTSLKSQ